MSPLEKSKPRYFNKLSMNYFEIAARMGITKSVHGVTIVSQVAEMKMPGSLLKVSRPLTFKSRTHLRFFTNWFSIL